MPQAPRPVGIGITGAAFDHLATNNAAQIGAPAAAKARPAAPTTDKPVDWQAELAPQDSSNVQFPTTESEEAQGANHLADGAAAEFTQESAQQRETAYVAPPPQQYQPLLMTDETAQAEPELSPQQMKQYLGQSFFSSLEKLPGGTQQSLQQASERGNTQAEALNASTVAAGKGPAMNSERARVEAVVSELAKQAQAHPENQDIKGSLSSGVEYLQHLDSHPSPFYGVEASYKTLGYLHDAQQYHAAMNKLDLDVQNGVPPEQLQVPPQLSMAEASQRMFHLVNYLKRDHSNDPGIPDDQKQFLASARQNVGSIFDQVLASNPGEDDGELKLADSLFHNSNVTEVQTVAQQYRMAYARENNIRLPGVNMNVMRDGASGVGTPGGASGAPTPSTFPPPSTPPPPAGAPGSGAATGAGTVGGGATGGAWPSAGGPGGTWGGPGGVPGGPGGGGPGGGGPGFPGGGPVPPGGATPPGGAGYGSMSSYPQSQQATMMMQQQQDWQNAMTVMTTMQADNQKQQMLRWQLIMDALTNTMSMMNKAASNRAATEYKCHQKWTEYIRNA